jgi:hypothetical protein
MSEPICVSFSSGSPTLRLFAASVNFATKSSYADCSTRIRERASQLWPAE